MRNRIIAPKIIFPLLLFLLLLLTPNQTQASENLEVSLPVSQQIINQTVTYQLTSLTAEAPVPLSINDGLFTLRNNETKELHFLFQTPGKYDYLLTPINNDIVDNLSEDQKNYRIELTVYNDQQMNLKQSIISIKNSQGYKVDRILFEKKETTLKNHTQINSDSSRKVLPKTGSMAETDSLSIIGILLILPFCILTIKRRGCISQ